MYKSARKYLRDPVTKGLRVSTEFKDVKLDFGRVTGYVFGYKEHGSTWNQQNIMYAYGLYRHGLVKQGGQLLEATVGRALNSGRTRLFPCIPSFFNRQGRGDYSYLTGSSSWLLVTLATQVYGVRGDFGDLVIAPQLSLKHFGGARRATLHGSFRGRTIAVTFENPDGLEWNKYEVATVEINGQSLDTIPHAAGGVRIPYQTFADMTSFDDNNVVTVHLTRRRRR
jgi:cellobiose phosphorylase